MNLTNNYLKYFIVGCLFMLVHLRITPFFKSAFLLLLFCGMLLAVWGILLTVKSYKEQCENKFWDNILILITICSVIIWDIYRIIV